MWPAAIVFYQHAIDIPLTDDEAKKLSRTYQVYVPIEKVRAMFEVKVREDMSECLLKLGMKEQSQKATTVTAMGTLL